MRTKSVFYSLVTTFAYQIITAITNFIALKIFILNFGSELNGLTSSIVQVINYINIVEAGLALTAIKALYKPLRENDIGSINSILAATNKLYKYSGSVFMGIVVIISIVYPNILDTNISKQTISILIIVMAGGSIVEYFLNGKMRVLLVADQKSYMLNIFQIIGVFISFSAKIYLILNGYNIIMVQLVSTITSLLRVVLTKIYINKKYSFVNYRVLPDKDALKDRWSVLFHQFAGLVVFNSPIIIISLFCSLEEASLYAVYNFVFGSLLVVMQLFSKSVVASFGNLISEQNNKRLQDVFSTYQAIYFCFATTIYTVTFLVIKPFIKLYTAGINDFNYNNNLLIYMFLIIGIANSCRIPCNTLIEASGQYKETQNRAFIEAMINISISIIAVQKIGIYGVLLGSICSFMYRTIDIIQYSHSRILHSEAKYTYKNILINLFLAFIICALVIKYIPDYMTWISWILISLIITIISVTITLIGNNIFYPRILKQLRDRLSCAIKVTNIKNR